ncbi:KxYKxGKxW signal peptide domain-containing protein [Streptococcus tangpeifui]|uniref:KxYKxGKxW signal peptide domain-containing protein n=1 Tax=Streptococcus tangpeifui TaxID=2709400 RepID=UPI0013EB5768|nr:KxYKxGKxW signal peptide domain-containing protein [Streptococcus sp. ZJ1593]
MEKQTRFKLHKVKKHWVTIAVTATAATALFAVGSQASADQVAPAPQEQAAAQQNTPANQAGDQKAEQAPVVQQETPVAEQKQAQDTPEVAPNQDETGGDQGQPGEVKQAAEQNDKATDNQDIQANNKQADAQNGQAAEKQEGQAANQAADKNNQAAQKPEAQGNNQAEQAATPAQPADLAIQAPHNSRAANSFNEENGQWYFLDANKQKVTGWQTIDGKKFYFNQDGSQVRGNIAENNGKIYYLDKDNGQVITDKIGITPDSKAYYFAEDGSRLDVTGLHEVNGKTYYFNDDFSIADSKGFSGWQTIDNKQVYFNKGYQVTDGFADIDGKTYYFDENGNVNRTGGLRKIQSSRYYFDSQDGTLFKKQFVPHIDEDSGQLVYYYADENGRLVYGYQTIDGLNYYFKQDGRQLKGIGYDKYGKAIVTDKDTGIILEGEAARTAQYRDQVSRTFTKGQSDIIYYDENGNTVSNRFVYDKDYPTNIKRSAHQTGWLYIGEDGKAVKGDQLIDGVLYHFDKKYGGQYKNTVYHQQEQGLDGSAAGYYYLDSNGRPVKNAFIQVNTEDYQGYYYANEDGQLAEGWKTIDGKTYYFAKPEDTTYYYDHRTRFGQIKGQMLIIDGAKYYFDPNTGELVKNKTVTIDKNNNPSEPLGYPKIETVTVDGKDYTLGQDGKAQENYGFITKEDGKTYYQLEDGNYAKGLIVIDHKNYYFDKETGEMVKNKIILDEDHALYGFQGSRYYSTYYFGKDGYGVKGFQTIDGKRYYFGDGGQSVSSNYPRPIYVEDDLYYIKNDQVVTDTLVQYGLASFGYNPSYNNQVGYFGADGKLQQGWYEKDGKTYYTVEPENADIYQPSYTRANGVHGVDQDVYGFDKDSGELKPSGWYQAYPDRNEWRYLDANGKVLTGWQVIDGKTYYFSLGHIDKGVGDEYKRLQFTESTGIQVKGELVDIDGNQYYFDPDSGELWVNRTLDYEGHTYQLDDKGKATLIH